MVRRKILKILAPQSGVFKPVLPDECHPSCLVIRRYRVISLQQIANEIEIVRESRVGKLIQTHIHRRGTPADRREVRLQRAAIELLDSILRQLLERGIFPVTQVEARQLTVPGGIGETRERSPVHFLLFLAEIVLLQKNGETLVQARIVRVVINLSS